MIVDRQPIVQFSVPCEFVSVAVDGSECRLDLKSAEVVLKGDRVRRMLCRMAEAKRKRSGTFRLSLQFPSSGIRIGELTGRLSGNRSSARP